MRMICVYTPQIKASARVANRCINSAKKLGYDVELHPSVYLDDMISVHQEYGLKRKYKPSTKSHRLQGGECPATRMANGTTHYLLYKWCVENCKPICIVEHDSVFVGKIPAPKTNGVIQISSHAKGQSDRDHWHRCSRAIKMRKYQPNYKFVWIEKDGVVKHPLSGMNGTSGYIIHPSAAKKMIDYIERDGIAQADRVRTEWIGEGNLYLQKPQSVVCPHDVRSTRESRGQYDYM